MAYPTLKTKPFSNMGHPITPSPDLIRQIAEEVSEKSYRKGWLDAASMTRLIAKRNMVHPEILLAVADSMEKAIESQDNGAL